MNLLAEYAPGIPSRANKEVPRISEPQDWRMAIQKHTANRAGVHYDLRIIDDKTGKAYSWALRYLPNNPGDKVLAKLQPTHTAEYATWSGKIDSGYGAGNVKLFDQDKIEVTKADLEHITFNVYKSNGDTERYALINTGNDNWLFHNTTPTRITRPEIPDTKPSYKSIAIDKLDPNDRNQIWAPKIDGALNAFLLRKDKAVEVYSYRPSVKSKVKLIDHTYRLPYYKTKMPKAFRGKTVVLGEVFARDRDGNVLPATDTSARLLSNVWRSRDLQKTAPLDNIVYNVLRYQGKDVSKKPYSEKLEILKRITQSMPQLKMPPLAQTPEQKMELLKQVQSGKHPLTTEGLVVYDLTQDTPMKAKIFADYDVHVRGFTEGENKFKGTGVGAFTYSHTPSGPIAGRVGSGLTDDMRIDMFKHPKKYQGHVARVLAQNQFPSGALSKPSFKDFRSELWKKGAVELTPYQSELQKRLKKQHGVVVAWGLGSGKTIGSIAAADQFGKAQAVVPASLRENFKKELRA